METLLCAFVAALIATTQVHASLYPTPSPRDWDIGVIQDPSEPNPETVETPQPEPSLPVRCITTFYYFENFSEWWYNLRFSRRKLLCTYWDWWWPLEYPVPMLCVVVPAPWSSWDNCSDNPTEEIDESPPPIVTRDSISVRFTYKIGRKKGCLQWVPTPARHDDDEFVW